MSLAASRAAWPHPRVIAHRGGGLFAPENTLAAFRAARAFGHRAVEFDVMLCADGVPVLIHDETLERTTDGRGRVAETPWSALAELDAGGWFSERFRGERIPTLAHAAALCRALELWANLEIKPAAGRERETARVTATAAREAWAGAAPPLLSSFSLEALEAAREAAPAFPRGLLVEHIEPGWEKTLRQYGCVSLHCGREGLDPALAREVKDAGYALLVWTVNDPTEARRLFSLGVDAIFTDRLDLIGPDFS